MPRVLNVIDSDGHITEPLDLWENYIDPRYRATCPKIFIYDNGAEYMFRVDDRISFRDRPRPKKPSVATAVTFGARNGVVMSSYLDAEQGGFDPHARIEWLDREGFDGTVLYPTMALLAIQAVVDPARQIAIANAYNRYLADFCRPYGDRLFGVALLPLLSVEGAIKEVSAARKLGMSAGMVRPNPSGGKALHDPAFYPLWNACEDMDFAIAVHGSAGVDNVGMDRFDSKDLSYMPPTTDNGPVAQGVTTRNPSFAVEHCFVHTAEMMAAATSFVLAGVCDKHPKLKVAFVEAGAGWMPAYVDRMDRHFDDVGMNDMELSTRPSEIFKRQCFISFEPVESCIRVLADHFGPNKLMVATDYPHSDGFPETLRMVRDMKFKPEVEAALLNEGFKTWYGLN